MKVIINFILFILTFSIKTKLVFTTTIFYLYFPKYLKVKSHLYLILILQNKSFTL